MLLGMVSNAMGDAALLGACVRAVVAGWVPRRRCVRRLLEGVAVVIVAFDLGMSMGWAVLDTAGKRIDSGRLKLPPSPRAQRWIVAAGLVRSLLEQRRPSRMVFERPVGRNDGGGRATFIVHGGLLAQLEVEAHRSGMREPVALSPAEWKKASTGNGNASKPAYVAAENERFGLHLAIKGEDEAAALLIGYAAIKLGKVGG